MSHTLNLLPWSALQRKRYRLRPYLERLSKADADDTPPQWFEDRVRKGLALAHEILSSEGETEGLLLVEVLDFQGHRDLNVLGLSVDARSWKDSVWPQILDLARAYECQGVRGTTGRPEACQRAMYDRVGMKRHTVTYRVHLGEQEAENEQG